MKVFHAGMPAWKKAGAYVIMEQAALEGWVKNGEAHVLVDLREAAAAEKGFIPGAVGIPSPKLAGAKDRFPENKKAPVVLYAEGQATFDDFSTVRGWGYSNTAVLAGGSAAWRGERRTGPLASKIEYVKRPKPGEVPIDAFRQAVGSAGKDVFLLDVRDGAVDGRVPGAVAIPQAELAGRLGEVPKDKKVVIFCNTGILARMAHDLLRSKGYADVGYLDAVMQVGPDGTYEVTEK